MTLHPYSVSFREGVNALLAEEHWDTLPDKVGGYGLVCISDGEVVGFCWALTSEESEIAYIESFIVRKDHRGTLFFTLIHRMLSDLVAQGKTRIVGAVPRGEPYSEMLARYYHHVGGMKVAFGYFFTGDARQIVDRVSEFRRKAA